MKLKTWHLIAAVIVLSLIAWQLGLPTRADVAADAWRWVRGL